MLTRTAYHFAAFFVLSVVAIGVLRSGALGSPQTFFWLLTSVQLVWGLLVFPPKSLRLGRIAWAVAVLAAIQGLQYLFNIHAWRPEAFSLLEVARYLVFVALVEEIWFRGVLQQYLSKYSYIGIGAAAVIFGLYHVHSGWNIVLITAAVGLVYAAARHAGAGILSLAVAHGAMNWANNTVFPPVGLRFEAAVFYTAFPVLCVVAAVCILLAARGRQGRGS